MSLIDLTVWRLDEALELIRKLQPEVQSFGYHIALGGSVLNYGKSNKDLDLYFLMLEGGKKPQVEELLEYLNKTPGLLEDLGENYSSEYYEYKMKTADGKRIDIFIVGELIDATS